MKLEHEHDLDHCPCCSTGDYSELFSKKKSEKRTNLRMGILYFIFICLSAINTYITATAIVISCIIIAYFGIKKDKDHFIRSLFLIVFCILGYVIKKAG